MLLKIPENRVETIKKNADVSLALFHLAELSRLQTLRRNYVHSKSETISEVLSCSIALRFLIA